MRARARIGRFHLLAAVFLLAVLGPAAVAHAGQGEGYFYGKGPEPIPDGHGDAQLKIFSSLPMDMDPVLDDVNLSLRVSHPRTRDLVVELKRPDYVGPAGAATAALRTSATGCPTSRSQPSPETRRRAGGP